MEKKHKRQNRALKFIFPFLLFELLVNLYSSTPNFSKKHKDFVYQSYTFSQELLDYAFDNTVFLVQYGKMNFDQGIRKILGIKYDPKILREAMKKEQNISQIRKLISKDEKEDFNEIGGLLYLDKDYKLNFYPIHDKFHSLVSKLDSYRGKCKAFKSYYEMNKEFFYEIRILEKEESGYQIVFKGIRPMDLNSTINKFKIMRDNSYLLTNENLRDFLSQNILHGNFFSFFHLHAPWGERPSDRDLELSKRGREVVISSDRKGFDVWVLEDSSIVDSIFYRDNNWRIP
jgi:hypothetical protein